MPLLFETPSLESILHLKEIPYRIRKIFKDDFFALTLLVSDSEEQYWVLKISRIKVPWLRIFQPLLTWLGKREALIYQYLQGTKGIPLLKDFQANWFLHEFIQGDTLKVSKIVSDSFFDELLLLLQTLHQKNVAYVDLDKKDNIIVGFDQKPYLIDFQISLKFKKTTGLLRHKLFHLFTESDLYHFYKHKRRIRKDLIQENEIQHRRKRSRLHTLHDYCLVRPFRWFKRKFLPAYF